MSAIRLVYVAGPYRGATCWDRDCNIQAARALGAEVCKLGAYSVVPHANTMHYDGINSDEFWLAATLELMARCDAVILLPTWERSSGARAERDQALADGTPIFYTLAELAAWMRRAG